MSIQRIKIYKYIKKQMGNYTSNEYDKLWYYHQINMLDYPHAWKFTYPKNIKYYTNKPTKISRGLYPQFTKGYLWGRYEDMNYWKELGWGKDINGDWITVPIEKEF